MASSPQAALSGLARAFVQHGRLLEAEALACSSQSANPNDFLVEVINRGLMKAADIALFAAETFGSPTLDLAAFDTSHLPADAIDRKLMIKHQVVALGRRGNRLTLALSDPSNLRILDEIRFQTGLAVDPVVVEVPKLRALVEQLSQSAATALKDLTGEEFEEMKTHARIGGDALARAVQRAMALHVQDGTDLPETVHFLQVACTIAYYHHEKWDGSGYPRGLKGKAIPHPARLMALADVYDALISNKVYKQGVEHEAAVQVIFDGLNWLGLQPDEPPVFQFARADRHDHRLGRVDHRVELLDPEHAEVGEAGGATLVLVRHQFAFTRLVSQGFHFPGNLSDPLACGVGNDRCDQARWRGDSDRDVGAAVLAQFVSGERDVALGHADQCLGERLDQKIIN